MLYILVFLFLVALMACMAYRETRKVEFSFSTLPLPHLHSCMENFRIAHITDIHYPFHVEKAALEKIIRFINVEKPDVVILTGDLVSTRDDRRMECPEILSALESRLGTFAVLGNHDYCYGRKELLEKLHEYGITVLRNEHLVLGPDDCKIQLLGLDDPSTFRDDREALFKKIPETALRILMMHSPDGISPLLTEKVHLILTGHTHGGQIRLPFIGGLYFPTRLMREFDSGWFKSEDRWVLVNRGLGFAMMPLRFMCPREVAFITLTSSGESIVRTKRRIL